MRMIDVFNLMAEGEIKEGAKLKVVDILENEYEYEYRNAIRGFLDEKYNGFGEHFDMNTSFLNREVHLEQPSKHEYKYRIKLPNSEFYVCLVKTKDNEKEIIPCIKDSLIIEGLIQCMAEKDLKFQTEFTEQDFEEIEELKPYEQFKELVKDDEKRCE